jgi:hypothetical protein
MMTSGLVTLEKVRVINYRGKEKANGDNPATEVSEPKQP